MQKYSIILPVRNGGQYVKECVYSILEQSFADLNLIVLDNHSQDGTREWIQSITDDRIVLFPSDRPLTIEENWKRILSVPKNEFITLIGHDDKLDKNYLQVMDRLIRKHPMASLYQAHFRYINAKGYKIRTCKPMDEKQTAAELLGFYLQNAIDIMGTGFMMRAIDYDRVGGIPSSYPNLLFADYELWLNLTRKNYKATAFEECFSYRTHQSTTAVSADLKFNLAFQQYVGYLVNLKKEDQELAKVIEKYGLEFLYFYCKGFAHRLLRTASSKREGQSIKGLIAQYLVYADQLVPGNHFNPLDLFSIKLAKQIDGNALTRSLFLAFKKIYPKPLFS